MLNFYGIGLSWVFLEVGNWVYIDFEIGFRFRKLIKGKS